MTSSLIDAPAAAVEGAQRPQRLLVPPDPFSSAGEECIELAASVGLFLDPWQQFVLNHALAEREDGTWQAFEVGLIVPRQNGKGSILEARELAGLFLFDEELILHSAHEFKTAEEAFRRIRTRIESSDALMKRVKAVRESHGEEGIELKARPTIITGPGGKDVTVRTSQRLRFVARTVSGSGRGFTAETIIWDEAFNLPDAVISAQMPILSAMPNPQLWYTSSAVNQDTHQHGMNLTRVRNRALAAIREMAAGDPAVEDALLWMEWQANEAEYAELLKRSPARARAFARQPQNWALANPGVPYRLHLDRIGREGRAMNWSKSFAVERLGIGDWPTIDDDVTVVDMDRWAVIQDPASRPGEPIALAFDVSPDGRTAALASAGRRDDGRWHTKLVTHRPGEGVGWIVDKVVDLFERFEVCAVVVDPSGPAGALLPDLRVHIPDWSPSMPHNGGIVVTTARTMAQACGAFYNDISPERDSLRVYPHENLDDAVREASTRPLADAWAWDRKTSTGDITPLVAATLALHGMRVHGREETVPWAAYG